MNEAREERFFCDAKKKTQIPLFSGEKSHCYLPNVKRDRRTTLWPYIALRETVSI